VLFGGKERFVSALGQTYQDRRNGSEIDWGESVLSNLVKEAYCLPLPPLPRFSQGFTVSDTI